MRKGEVIHSSVDGRRVIPLTRATKLRLMLIDALQRACKVAAPWAFVLMLLIHTYLAWLFLLRHFWGPVKGQQKFGFHHRFGIRRVHQGNNLMIINSNLINLQ